MKPVKKYDIPAIVSSIFRDESVGAKLVFVAAILSLIAVNSSFHEVYELIWQTKLGVAIGDWGLTLDLRHWINEGLMAIFFLVVGLEIKRELIKGTLRNRRDAVLPIGAAIGGMIVPALLFLAINIGSPGATGWGIPIATDIAFVIAIVVLLGRCVPISLKIFLLTLAIVDDIGAVIIIGLFYAETINYFFLALTLAITFSLWRLQTKLSPRISLFLLIGSILWLTAQLSGIQASITGAILGLLAPLKASEKDISIAERLEKYFLPVSTFFVLPLFAFVNAGFVLTTNSLKEPGAWSVASGILLGLVVGKVIGITGASWLLIKYKGLRLPEGASWRHMTGIGFIAGIGFTVSIFIAESAFYINTPYLQVAKMSVFAASIISALIGIFILKKGRRVS